MKHLLVVGLLIGNVLHGMESGDYLRPKRPGLLLRIDGAGAGSGEVVKAPIHHPTPTGNQSRRSLLSCALVNPSSPLTHSVVAVPSPSVLDALKTRWDGGGGDSGVTAEAMRPKFQLAAIAAEDDGCCSPEDEERVCRSFSVQPHEERECADFSLDTPHDVQECFTRARSAVKHAYEIMNLPLTESGISPEEIQRALQEKRDQVRPIIEPVVRQIAERPDIWTEKNIRDVLSSLDAKCARWFANELLNREILTPVRCTINQRDYGSLVTFTDLLTFLPKKIEEHGAVTAYPLDLILHLDFSLLREGLIYCAQSDLARQQKQFKKSNPEGIFDLPVITDEYLKNFFDQAIMLVCDRVQKREGIFVRNVQVFYLL